MATKTHAFDRRPFAAFVAAGLLAIFYLPYHIPQKATESFSYTFGYNNRAGVLLLLLLVAVAAVWTKGTMLPQPLRGESPKVSRRTLAIALLVVLAGCLTMWALAGRFGGFGESSYEIDRTWLASQGKRPYVDFEWPFGVSFLYLPLALKALCSLTLLGASYLFWVINFLLGTVVLYWTVNLVDYPTRAKRQIFVLFFAAGSLSVLFMGTHYTFLRYTLPLLLVLVVQRLADGGGGRGRTIAAVCAVFGTIVLLTISPETAIAHAFACACILPLSQRERGVGRDFAVYAGLLAADALVFGLALKLRVLDTVRASGRGADSFPIVVSPHILLFFLALFACACHVVRLFTQRRAAGRVIGDDMPDNTLGMLAYSLPMLAAALGRCDPLHVLCNGEGVLLASMFYVSNSASLWSAYRLGFVAIFILLPGLAVSVSYLPALERVGLDTLDEGGASPSGSVFASVARRYIASHGDAATRARWTDRLTHPGSFRVPERIDFAALYPSFHGELFAPFGYRPNGLGSYLSSDVDYGRYEGFENANTLPILEKKIAEMADRPHKALLLPVDFENYCVTDPAAERLQIRLLFSTVYSRRALHPESVRRPVCEYIRAHYRQVEAPDTHDFYYGLWVPAATSK